MESGDEYVRDFPLQLDLFSRSVQVQQAEPNKMGYDLNRFQGEVDEELTCPICSGVLEEPLQVNRQDVGSNFMDSLVFIHFGFKTTRPLASS